MHIANVIVTRLCAQMDLDAEANVWPCHKYMRATWASCLGYNWLKGTLPTGPKPVRGTRALGVKAMEVSNKQDQEQMFWEIRLYADRNKKMQSDVLDAITSVHTPTSSNAVYYFTVSLQSRCILADFSPRIQSMNKVRECVVPFEAGLDSLQSTNVSLVWPAFRPHAVKLSPLIGLHHQQLMLQIDS